MPNPAIANSVTSNPAIPNSVTSNPAIANSQRPLFLLDGMSLAFRAYFALLSANLSTADGIATNALHGFIAMVVNILRDHQPSALAVAFDLPGGTFRDDLVEDYKGGRAEIPDDLPPQFEMIRRVLEGLAIPVISAPGFEADDVLATLATECRERSSSVVVVTGDRDIFQLVEDPYIRVLYNRKGMSDYSLYDEAGILERTGVVPKLYPLLAALRGDPSDNLPGVPGVGDKTAARLLNQYGDLDGIFSNLDQLTPKLAENLSKYEHLARSNAAVIPLVRDVPLDVEVGDLNVGGWDLDRAKALFEEYGLKTLWGRISKLLPTSGLNTQEKPDLKSSPKGSPPVGPRLRFDAPDEVEVNFPGTPSDLREVIRSVAQASKDLEEPLVLVGQFCGLPGRSRLLGTVLSCGQNAIWVDPLYFGDARSSDARSSDASSRDENSSDENSSDASVVATLLEVLSAGGVIGIEVKELFRYLLDRGIDIKGLKMDIALGAYLLDPTVGDYGVESAVAILEGSSNFGGTEGITNETDSNGKDGPAKANKSTQGKMDLGGTDLSSQDCARALSKQASIIKALHRPMRTRLEEEGMLDLHDSVEIPLVRVLTRMEVIGIGVDEAELRRITNDLSSEAKRLEVEIHRHAGHEFKVNSTQQLRTVLYEELGLTPGRKTKTGYSTDAATLELLRDIHPIIDALLAYREVEKLRSTYGQGLISEIGPDSRIHATFRQTVTRTGRLSSERPNLHNIPVRSELGRGFRRAFVPRDGWEMLAADYDQIELRVLAHLSGDPGLKLAFDSNDDVHRQVGASLFRVSPNEVTASQRSKAKMVSYGLVYGMESYGLAKRLGTSAKEAKEIIEGYFGAFPGVKAYMEKVVAEARLQGLTRTGLGRIRPFPELSSPVYRVRQAAERQAMNAGIQGLAADIFKVALVRLDKSLEDGGFASRLVLQVHDEVIVEVAPGEKEEVSRLTQATLADAVNLQVPLVVSMGVGDSWASAKKD